ncbi:MAG TPA: Uma2 family endonuclease [Actinomycetota bacterium]|jgi:Uma2 family endonuclease
MATEHRTTGLTYEDLHRFPDDDLRREIIDGELFVTPSPERRHQEVVVELLGRIWLQVKEHGGKVYPAPLDVYLSEDTVVEPDVLFVNSEHLDRAEERYIRGAPDLVVEVSSPSTRRTDLTRKLEVYQRHGVPEYWFVDLDEHRILVHRLEGGRYAAPEVVERGGTLTSPLLPGLTIPVEEILGRPTA